MEQLSLLFKSLEDPTRLRILALLLDEPELCVCDLVAVLQLPQSTVSRHLAHLKAAGWLCDRREGVWVYYALARPLAPEQQSLLPLLRHFLHEEATAGVDRGRLQSLGHVNRCA